MYVFVNFFSSWFFWSTQWPQLNMVFRFIRATEDLYLQCYYLFFFHFNMLLLSCCTERNMKFMSVCIWKVCKWRSETDKVRCWNHTVETFFIVVNFLWMSVKSWVSIQLEWTIYRTIIITRTHWIYHFFGMFYIIPNSSFELK